MSDRKYMTEGEGLALMIVLCIAAIPASILMSTISNEWGFVTFITMCGAGLYFLHRGMNGWLYRQQDDMRERRKKR